MLTLILLDLLACASPTHSAMGRTLALQDDAGIVTLTWDGETARTYREGRQVAEAAAETWDAAMWSVTLPAYGEVRAPHSYGRVLTASEVKALGSCSWAPISTQTECGLSAACDCGQASSFVASMR